MTYLFNTYVERGRRTARRTRGRGVLGPVTPDDNMLHLLKTAKLKYPVVYRRVSSQQIILALVSRNTYQINKLKINCSRKNNCITFFFFIFYKGHYYIFLNNFVLSKVITHALLQS